MAAYKQLTSETAGDLQNKLIQIFEERAAHATGIGPGDPKYSNQVEDAKAAAAVAAQIIGLDNHVRKHGI